jgi:hypothetical protein
MQQHDDVIRKLLYIQSHDCLRDADVDLMMIILELGRE